MAKDTRPYFTLTNEYPEHRKIRRLSDKAFRLHVTLIGLCNGDRSDGIVGKHDLERLGPKPGQELIKAGLILELGDDTFQMHDYLAHQPSRIEIEKRISEKRKAGKVGGEKSNHTRNHVNKGFIEPNCEWCPGNEPDPE